MEVASSACGPLSRDTSACRQPTATSKSLSNTKRGTLPMSCAGQKATLKSQSTGGPQRRSHPGKVSSSRQHSGCYWRTGFGQWRAAEHTCLKLNFRATLGGVRWRYREDVSLPETAVCPARSTATKLALVLIASLDSKLLLKSTGTSCMLKPETQRQASRLTLLLPSLMAFPPGLTFSWQWWRL